MNISSPIKANIDPLAKTYAYQHTFWLQTNTPLYQYIHSILNNPLYNQLEDNLSLELEDKLYESTKYS